MGIKEFLEAPLQGKVSVSRVFWLYGVVGSLIYGMLEFLIDPGNTFLMRSYSIGGLILTIYVIIATYRSAVRCKSPWMAKLVRVSCIASLALLPLFVYWDLSGALSVDRVLQQLGNTGG